MNFKIKSSITHIDCHVDISEVPVIKEAQLVYVKGKGALTTRYHSERNYNSISRKYDEYQYYSQIMLNNIPLLQINSSGCPTCSSLLATGYGLEHAECEELTAIKNRMNSPFTSLKQSIDDITPILGLVDAGLYVIADAVCYPTDGNGKFFWDTSNVLSENPATAGVYLPDDGFRYISGHPIYLYPTQSASCLNEKRVEYYIDKFTKEAEHPRAIVYNLSEFMNFIIDGHHKACAAFLLKKPLHCIVILPFTGMSYKQADKKSIPNKLWFSSVTVNAKDVPKKYITLKENRKEVPFSIQTGTVNNITWEEKYKALSERYPTRMEYAKLTAAKLTYGKPIETALIMECLNDITDEHQQKLEAILYYLKLQKDRRLKQTALLCAKKLPSGIVKKSAYQILADIKNDEDIEKLFIEYIVECEDPHDIVLPIVESYWDEEA